MSEEESVLNKYTGLRDTLAMRLESISDIINGYDMYIGDTKRRVKKLNKILSLDDNEFLKARDDITILVDTVRYDERKLLQGDFTQYIFEYIFDKYIKDEQIDPAIRNKLKEIGNKVIEYEKDPLIQRFNNALENFNTQNDKLYFDIQSFIDEIDGKLIKYFLEHE